MTTALKGQNSLRTVIVVAAFALALAGPVWGNSQFPFIGEVTQDNLNVRAGQNTNFERLDTLGRGEEVVVLKQVYSWLQIRLRPSVRVYVRSDYILPLKDGLGQVLGNRVNVRAGAGTQFASLGQISDGDIVRIAGKTDEWTAIEPVKGIYGWVHQDFVKFKSAKVPEEKVLAVVKVDAAPAPAESPSASRKAPVNPWAPPESTKKVSVQGRLERSEQGAALGLADYKLIIDGKPAYSLNPDPGFAQFSGARVDVEGLVQTTSVDPYSYPRMTVTRIQLVF